MRNDIYERMKIMKTDDIKPNFAAIGRTFGCDYRTAKKYYYSDSKKPSKRKQMPSKLDQFKELIKDKLELNCSVTSIYKFIQNKGYTGKYTILRDYCFKYKKAELKKAEMRFETCPGLQAQVDWKETMTLTNRKNEPITFNIFLVVLGYSRMKFLMLTLDRTQDTVFKGLIKAFRYFGGVPHEILFDNMKTVVDHSKSNYKEAVINDSFYQFSRDMGFETKTCRPFRPQTKGKVESLAKLMDRLIIYNNEFDSFQDLLAIVEQFNEELNNEISQATNKTPRSLLGKEKEYLHKLPNDNVLSSYFDIPVINRIVSKEALVTYDNKRYSVNPQYVGQTVTLSVKNNILYIYSNKELIQAHPITGKKFNFSQENYLEIMKSNAFQDASPDEIQKIAENNLAIYDKF